LISGHALRQVKFVTAAPAAERVMTEQEAEIVAETLAGHTVDQS
jgi:hypothetical protein